MIINKRLYAAWNSWLNRLVLVQQGLNNSQWHQSHTKLSCFSFEKVQRIHVSLVFDEVVRTRSHSSFPFISCSQNIISFIFRILALSWSNTGGDLYFLNCKFLETVETDFLDAAVYIDGGENSLLCPQGMAFSLEERLQLGTHGLLPPCFISQDVQLMRVLKNYDMRKDDLDRWS